MINALFNRLLSRWIEFTQINSKLMKCLQNKSSKHRSFELQILEKSRVFARAMKSWNIAVSGEYCSWISGDSIVNYSVYSCNANPEIRVNPTSGISTVRVRVGRGPALCMRASPLSRSRCLIFFCCEAYQRQRSTFLELSEDFHLRNWILESFELITLILRWTCFGTRIVIIGLELLQLRFYFFIYSTLGWAIFLMGKGECNYFIN